MTLVLICTGISSWLLGVAWLWARSSPALDDLDRAIDRIGEDRR